MAEVIKKKSVKKRSTEGALLSSKQKKLKVKKDKLQSEQVASPDADDDDVEEVCVNSLSQRVRNWFLECRKCAQPVTSQEPSDLMEPLLEEDAGDDTMEAENATFESMGLSKSLCDVISLRFCTMTPHDAFIMTRRALSSNGNAPLKSKANQSR